MIVAKNIGRTGNNLFQIAAAIGHAKRYNYQWAADYGMGMGEPYSNIHKSFPNLPKGELSGNRYHEHPNEHCIIHGVHKNLCHFDYHPIPNLGPNMVLSGFFQSYKYFENAEAEVKEAFNLPILPCGDYVSIHVRRTDYVQHSGSFPPVTDEYLQKAMELVYNELGIEKFMVFSDDIEWCKQWAEHNSRKEFVFSEWRTELEDMALMASCAHNIISNSTFSWWASFLNRNPEKMIVSPSCKRGNWFGMQSGIKKDCTDLIPPTWHQIEFR